MQKSCWSGLFGYVDSRMFGYFLIVDPRCGSAPRVAGNVDCDTHECLWRMNTCVGCMLGAWEGGLTFVFRFVRACMLVFSEQSGGLGRKAQMHDTLRKENGRVE
jgi:hypothetical protein